MSLSESILAFLAGVSSSEESKYQRYYEYVQIFVVILSKIYVPSFLVVFSSSDDSIFLAGASSSEDESIAWLLFGFSFSSSDESIFLDGLKSSSEDESDCT